MSIQLFAQKFRMNKYYLYAIKISKSFDISRWKSSFLFFHKFKLSLINNKFQDNG